MFVQVRLWAYFYAYMNTTTRGNCRLKAGECELVKVWLNSGVSCHQDIPGSLLK